MIRVLFIPMLLVTVVIAAYASLRRGRGAVAWGASALLAQIGVALALIAMTETEIADIGAETAVVGLFFLPVLLGGGGTWLLLRLLPKR